jgi:hypothetical protein
LASAAPNNSDTPAGRLSALALAAGSGTLPAHLGIVISYKPHGVIDFNRPDLLLREIRKRLSGLIWLDEIEGWHGEKEAFLELRMESEVLFFSDQPRPNAKKEP